MPVNNVINVPRVPTTGPSNLVPLKTVSLLTQSLGPQGDGLKTKDWKAGIPTSSLPQQARDRAVAGSTAYELTASVAGVNGKVFALTVPGTSEGTWIGLYDEKGTELAHAQTQNPEGWNLMLGKSDSFGGTKPAPANPGMVVHVPPAPTHSVSDSLSLAGVGLLTQSLGPQGVGLKDAEWSSIAPTELPKAAQDRIVAGSTAYKFNGDVSHLPNSSGEVFVLKSPGTAYGAWMGMYDGGGKLVAHAQENDPVGWNLMVR